MKELFTKERYVNCIISNNEDFYILTKKKGVRLYDFNHNLLKSFPLTEIVRLCLSSDDKLLFCAKLDKGFIYQIDLKLDKIEKISIYKNGKNNIEGMYPFLNDKILFTVSETIKYTDYEYERNLFKIQYNYTNKEKEIFHYPKYCISNQELVTDGKVYMLITFYKNYRGEGRENYIYSFDGKEIKKDDEIQFDYEQGDFLYFEGSPTGKYYYTVTYTNEEIDNRQPHDLYNRKMIIWERESSKCIGQIEVTSIPGTTYGKFFNFCGKECIRYMDYEYNTYLYDFIDKKLIKKFPEMIWKIQSSQKHNIVFMEKLVLKGAYSVPAISAYEIFNED